MGECVRVCVCMKERLRVRECVYVRERERECVCESVCAKGLHMWSPTTCSSTAPSSARAGACLAQHTDKSVHLRIDKDITVHLNDGYVSKRLSKASI